jgi:hypothetical protein
MTFPVFAPGDVLNASDMNAVGTWLVKTATFSAVSSLVVSNVFDANYRDYLLVLRYETSGVTNIVYQNRTGSTSANSNYNLQRVLARVIAGPTNELTTARATSQTSFSVFQSGGGAFLALGQLFISGPALAEPTLFEARIAYPNGAYTAPEYWTAGGNHSTTTSYDGFELTVATGTMTGTYHVYGLR